LLSNDGVGFFIFSIMATIIINVMSMKNIVLVDAAPFPVVVIPNASASLSKH